MNKQTFKRRDFLKLAGWTALGMVGACAPTQATVPPTSTESQPTEQPTKTLEPAPTPEPANSRKRVLRIAHMTDFHVQPEDPAPDGTIRALRHAQGQEDPPDIIINTGDSIMESLETDKGRAEAQWEVFNSIMKSESRIPVFHAIGNHDVWGWGRADAGMKNDPLYGKEMAVEKLGLADRYYSFDRAGWHFSFLDSTHLPNSVSKLSYIGALDDEQFQWLQKDVSAVPAETPICIASHIPVVAACMYFDGPNEESGNWVVPASWIHIDARRFRELFLQHPNIKLCLSGHTHQYEVLDYLGVRYMTNGAVCGNWWNGVYMEFPPAYVLVNLYEDGSVDSTFVPYEMS